MYSELIVQLQGEQGPRGPSGSPGARAMAVSRAVYQEKNNVC